MITGTLVSEKPLAKSTDLDDEDDNDTGEGEDDDDLDIGFRADRKEEKKTARVDTGGDELDDGEGDEISLFGAGTKKKQPSTKSKPKTDIPTFSDDDAEGDDAEGDAGIETEGHEEKPQIAAPPVINLVCANLHYLATCSINVISS